MRRALQPCSLSPWERAGGRVGGGPQCPVHAPHPNPLPQAGEGEGEGEGEHSRTIVFSHANGFPAATYRQLFEHWRGAGWRVLALPKFGHDSRFAVTSNWPQLRDELLHFIDVQRAAPAYLVGHSLGGYLSLLAASRRPEVARGIVLLDSPVLPNWMGRTVQFFKASGIGERFSPGHVSKRRREHWPSVDAARAHFAAKPVFARWAEGVLEDYLACGLESAPRPTNTSSAPQGGLSSPAKPDLLKTASSGETAQHLSFSRRIETTIYNTLPHHLARLLRTHPPHCPVAFVAGTRSEEMRRVGLSEVKRIARLRITLLDGSHLFPMEQPQATANAVLHWLTRFDAARASRPAA